MNYKFFPLLLLLLLIFIGCKGQAVVEKESKVIKQSWFDSDSLLKHVEVLSSDEFEGRKTGTPGSEKTRNYIRKAYKNLGVLPLTDSYSQSFKFSNYKAENIIGYIKGTQKPESYIVISAHHDHLGIHDNKIFNGADDDASGVSALFAFAEYFKKYPPKHSVILVAFDAEELGLRGSKYFVNNTIVPFDSIKLNINLDMISRNDNNELYVVGARFNDDLNHAISSFKTKKGLVLTQGHDGNDGLQNWSFSGDHGSFYRKGIPFLYFGVEDHEDYHMATDDYENIHPNFYQNAVYTIISVFKTLDDINL
ncbi:M20/M25/M40 family metallo-hydrolase [Corallibacter vietnamensis]|uniref:M20/M25/M40 family metallo-hydrolase n=1 Tax=Corallibacter vietnamensis TaxID=904130 RepID=A0ABP7GVE8_9FLAO